MPSKRDLSVALVLLLALMVPGLIDRVLLLLSALLVFIISRLNRDSGAEEPGQ